MLPPVPGDPTAVRRLADRLAATGEQLAGTAGVLSHLRAGADWDGPAGAAFSARVGEVPGVLEGAARRHRGAVGPLRALAAALEDAQVETTAAQRAFDDAEDWYARLEARACELVLGGATEGDPQVLALRSGQREQVAEMSAARARHAAAVGQLREVDGRCAATLRALADDGLADPPGYRALRAASGTGAAMGAAGALGPLAPELAPVALAGDVLGAAADGTLLMTYGEGSWGALTGSVALGALGAAGSALRSGARAGAEVTEDGIEVTRRLSARERIVAGAAAEARRRVGAVQKRFAVPPGRGTPSALLGGPAVRRGSTTASAGVVRRAGDALRARATAALDRAFLDDWRLATANGTRPMYTAGVTLQVGERAGRRVADRVDPAEGRGSAAGGP